MKEQKLLIVDARVRYWEDATINGVEDLEGSLVPFREGNSWKPVIEFEAGIVRGWPQGMIAYIHYKVCDDGDYWLAAEDGEKLRKWYDHYVPERFLCHGDEGFGDYIILDIDGSGQIKEYRKPVVRAEQWETLAS